MTVLCVMASRHSAFYRPLLGAIAGGFLQEEGFDPVYAPLPPGKTVAQLLVAGEIDVAQSAVSLSWGPLQNYFAEIRTLVADLEVRARRWRQRYMDITGRDWVEAKAEAS